jgi:cardiolipin synthase
VVEEGRSAPDTVPAHPEDHAHDIYTVANIITILRLVLVPFFFSVLLTGTSDTLAFALFALAASTDWLDGQIARRTGTVTAIGKAIDPLVDRLLIAAALVGLFIEGRLPLWILIVLVLRDAYLLYGSWRLERYHLRMPVTFTGKTTTAVLLFGFSLLILGWPTVPGLGVIASPEIAQYFPGWGAEPALLGIWFVYAGVVLSLSAAVQYTLIAARMVRESRAANSQTTT